MHFQMLSVYNNRMTLKVLTESDQSNYEKLAAHPLQSWIWGEFRKKTGVWVVRAGVFANDKMIDGFQLTFHPVPYTNYTVGYFPRGKMPTKEMVDMLTEVGKNHNAIFIKLEPNVENSSKFEVRSSKLKTSTRPLFTKYTFYIDLTKSENELLKNFESKTRYNIRVAQKHGVTVQEENTEEAFERYLELTQETTKRQGFYAHTPEYHRKMWETLRQSSGQTLPIAHLLTARYQGNILVTWIVFLYKNILYYPYGASSVEFKNAMASNLMMWEAILWGKTHGATLFNLWGTPGPNPKPSDPYYGFHRFKLGYGPKLVEFIGSYDLVLNPVAYKLFTLADSIRWNILRFHSRIDLH